MTSILTGSNNLHTFGIEDEIFWFHIAMDQTLPVNVLQGDQHASNHELQAGEREAELAIQLSAHSSFVQAVLLATTDATAAAALLA